MKNMVKI